MKQVEVARDCAERLAASGIVDRAFPKFLSACGVPALLLGPAHHMAVADAVCDDPQIGPPIVVR